MATKKELENEIVQLRKDYEEKINLLVEQIVTHRIAASAMARRIDRLQSQLEYARDRLRIHEGRLLGS